MLKGIITDLDGTILDSMQIWNAAGERFLQTVGRTPKPDFLETVWSMTLEESAAYMKEHYKLSLPEAEIQRQVLATVQNFYEREVRMKPGADRLLEAICRLGIPVVAATSGDRILSSHALRRLGILRQFAGIFTCEEVGAGKHAPDIYQKAAAFLQGADNFLPADFLVCEDALYCLETAHGAGFRTCAMLDDSSRADWEQIREISDFVLTGHESLQDLLRLLEQL